MLGFVVPSFFAAYFILRSLYTNLYALANKIVASYVLVFFKGITIMLKAEMLTCTVNVQRLWNNEFKL